MCMYGDHFKCQHIEYCSRMFLSFKTIKFVSILSENKKNHSKLVMFLLKNACVCLYLKYTSIPISMHLHKMCEKCSILLRWRLTLYFEFCSFNQHNVISADILQKLNFVVQKICVVPVTSTTSSEWLLNRFMSHTYTMTSMMKLDDLRHL